MQEQRARRRYPAPSTWQPSIQHSAHPGAHPALVSPVPARSQHRPAAPGKGEWAPLLFACFPSRLRPFPTPGQSPDFRLQTHWPSHHLPTETDAQAAASSRFSIPSDLIDALSFVAVLTLVAAEGPSTLLLCKS
ncbi:hypothetical protein VDGL01_03868 [Verticillium dahliae]